VRKDTQTVNVSTSAQAKAWARELGCSVAELRIATRAFGTSKLRVRAYLAALSGRPDDVDARVSIGGLTSPIPSAGPKSTWPLR